jgi:hypothetical protein
VLISGLAVGVHSSVQPAVSKYTAVDLYSLKKVVLIIGLLSFRIFKSRMVEIFCHKFYTNAPQLRIAKTSILKIAKTKVPI